MKAKRARRSGQSRRGCSQFTMAAPASASCFPAASTVEAFAADNKSLGRLSSLKRAATAVSTTSQNTGADNIDERFQLTIETRDVCVTSFFKTQDAAES